MTTTPKEPDATLGYAADLLKQATEQIRALTEENRKLKLEVTRLRWQLQEQD